MIDKCNTCIHKNICVLKQHIKDGNCNDYRDENKTYNTHYGIYDVVYIIDRFDLDNNCSQISDGSGSKNIELVVRECFITSITIHDKSGDHLYWVQPKNLTQFENNGLKHFYWDQSRYAKSLFKDKQAAIAYLKDLGFKEVKVL